MMFLVMLLFFDGWWWFSGPCCSSSLMVDEDDVLGHALLLLWWLMLMMFLVMLFFFFDGWCWWCSWTCFSSSLMVDVDDVLGHAVFLWWQLMLMFLFCLLSSVCKRLLFWKLQVKPLVFRPAVERGRDWSGCPGWGCSAAQDLRSQEWTEALWDPHQVALPPSLQGCGSAFIFCGNGSSSFSEFGSGNSCFKNTDPEPAYTNCKK